MLKSFFGSNEDNDEVEPNVHTRLAGNDVEASDDIELGYWDRMKRFVAQPESDTTSTDEPFFPDLSYQTRFLGFLSCFAAGFVLSFFSSFTLMTGNVKRFAFIYTVGNLVALLGTGFLMGPKRQLESMFDDKRKISSCIYLSCLVLTIYMALRGKSILIVLPFLIAQWCGGIWYSASYIPYGRSAIKGFISTITGYEL